MLNAYPDGQNLLQFPQLSTENVRKYLQPVYNLRHLGSKVILLFGRKWNPFGN